MAPSARISASETLVRPREEVLHDYRIICESREASLLGRKEVFMGKAKFGIFGDGKEVAQVAMAKVFRRGDFRSGYYRDQTFMMAIGELTIQQMFAQLYAHTDVEADPASAGRLMNGHFATRMLDDAGRLKPLAHLYNSSADISPTAAQMPRLLGMAYASKLFRNNKELEGFTDLSTRGNEVAFGTIGNGSTSEGMFFETMNAAGVLQVPILLAVWDDGYGISVPNEYHTTKESISKAMAGFQRTREEPGIEILSVRGWDYEKLIRAFEYAERICRTEHVPVLLHVTELTQPQGHSSSGSHERYKSKERLAWEREFDCNRKMREWIIATGIALPAELDEIEKAAKTTALAGRDAAWQAYLADVRDDQERVTVMLDRAAAHAPEIGRIREDFIHVQYPARSESVRAVRRALRHLRSSEAPIRGELLEWLNVSIRLNHERFSSHLYSDSDWSALKVPVVPAVYTEDAPLVDGREILQACFRLALERDPRIFALGEDVGRIGDVNQGFAGLQAQFGEWRVTDTSIREVTIIGQGVGAALRGLRPIAEIQYLDYLVYALQTLTDDLACLHYRTRGGQKAPLIIRTRGHRLEGVWHSGSPMSMILGALRGIYLLVPRNMTQAAGMYNTLLQSDDPAILVECLNGYRIKERMPSNPDEFTVPLGVPDILREGHDLTVVTYGAMCRIALEAAEDLESHGISAEVIDVQTLLPFDIGHTVVESLKKTGRVIFADEDVPGGGTAFMMQQVLEVHGGHAHLDAMPRTVSGKDHRPAYGSDGDYFSKPNAEDIFECAYALMNDSDPVRFPDLFS